MAVNLKGPLSALQVMQDAPVIPVIVLHDVAHAVPMARALVAGGIRMLEVTLRTPQALACMEVIAKEVPGAVVGAGTVRSAAGGRRITAGPDGPDRNAPRDSLPRSSRRSRHAVSTGRDRHRFRRCDRFGSLCNRVV